MHICIDSSAFILGLLGNDPAATQILELVGSELFIGAFAEWMNVSYLISENRHFLRDLKTNAFQVLDAAEFVKLWEANIENKQG